MRRLLLLTIVPCSVIVVACRHDGRTLRPAGPDQNVSISTTSSTVTPTSFEPAEAVQSTLGGGALGTVPGGGSSSLLGTDTTGSGG